MKKFFILLIGLLLLGLFVYGAGEDDPDWGAYVDGNVKEEGDGKFTLVDMDASFFVNNSDGETESMIKDIDPKRPATVTIDDNDQITEMEMTAGKDTQIKINGEFINVPKGMTVKYKEGDYEFIGGENQVISYGTNEDLLADIKLTKPSQKISIGKDNIVEGEGIYIGKDFLQKGRARMNEYGEIDLLLGKKSLATINIENKQYKILTLKEETYVSREILFKPESFPQGTGGININSYEGEVTMHYKNVAIQPPVEEKYHLQVSAKEEINTLVMKNGVVNIDLKFGGEVQNGVKEGIRCLEDGSVNEFIPKMSGKKHYEDVYIEAYGVKIEYNEEGYIVKSVDENVDNAIDSKNKGKKQKKTGEGIIYDTDKDGNRIYKKVVDEGDQVIHVIKDRD